MIGFLSSLNFAIPTTKMNRNELIKVICILKNCTNLKSCCCVRFQKISCPLDRKCIGIIFACARENARTMKKNLLLERLLKPPFPVLKNAV